MDKPIVVIVDPYSSGNLLAPALRDAGLLPVAVTSARRPPAMWAGSYHPEDFHQVIAHAGHLGETLAHLRALTPVAVLAGAESGVELADRLAALVTPGRANDPALAAARRDKGAMASAVAAAGLPGVAQVCTADAAEVEEWLARPGGGGHDLVLKPPKSAGTDGVTRVPAGADWRPAFHRLLGGRNKLGLVNDRVLVQEYLTGTEYVVDTCTFDGTHTVTDICVYRKRHNAGHMAVYDYMEWLPHDTPGHAELVGFATRVLDAVGVRFGAAHIEIMRTGQGPRLIEVNARIAGGGVPEYCREATGDSQVDRLARYLAGDRAVPAGFTLRKTVRGVLFVARTPGVLRNAEEYRRVRSLASHHASRINVRSGDRVAATHDLYSSHALGYVILAHEHPEQVRADYEAVRRIERGLVYDQAR
ncbi:ATP-grasp domain-containing protein [Sphaerisporangium corydalis]|uniref:ATP-grasp domain-containing protein n=1 Tax=Sphaerisporangium corydalis TaxID=1441875 RepID=A0ABV9E8E2_9ACTN|nr:ATP-grasp domain-containing protein [Sphaerisporangium corydalis]